MKKMVSFLLSALLAGGLVACGAPVVETQEAADGTSPTVSEEVSSSVEKTQEVTLSMVLTNYGRYKEQIDDLTGKFAEKKLEEDNIKVTFNIEYPSDTTLLRTRLSTGEAPDLFTMHAALDAPLYDRGGYLPDLSEEPFVDKLLEGMKDAVTQDGKIVGVPLESSSWGYLYNKKMFRENNLTPPQTLSEMQEVIDTLKAAGITPFELAYKDAYVCGWGVQVPMCSIAANKMPDWYDKMDQGEESFQSLVDEGLLDIFDLINANGDGRPLEIGCDDGVANFARGEAAMLVTGPWYSDSILSVDPEFELGVAPFPIDDDPEHAKLMLAVSTVMTMSPSSENADICREFLNYILDDEVTSDFFNSVQFGQVATNQEIEATPWVEEGASYVEQGKVYSERPLTSYVNDELGRIAQLYYQGELDREGFVREMDLSWARAMEAAE